MHRKLEPKLLSVLKEGYTFKQFQGDIMGGLTVGVVALPLAIALAIASGVKPEQGLYTAIVAGGRGIGKSYFSITLVSKLLADRNIVVYEQTTERMLAIPAQAQAEQLAAVNRIRLIKIVSRF